MATIQRSVSDEFLMAKINQLTNKVEELKNKFEAVEKWSYEVTNSGIDDSSRIHNLEQKVAKLENKVNK